MVILHSYVTLVYQRVTPQKKPRLWAKSCKIPQKITEDLNLFIGLSESGWVNPMKHHGKSHETSWSIPFLDLFAGLSRLSEKGLKESEASHRGHHLARPVFRMCSQRWTPWKYHICFRGKKKLFYDIPYSMIFPLYPYVWFK